MRALHELCWALRGLRLHRLERAQAPRLAAFCAGQAAALDAAGAALEGFGAAAAEVMAAACVEALQALQTRLNTFAQRQARARTCSWQHCCCSDARLRVSCACCRQWH